ncbi:heterokaryon incompatibility protein-domain-containing protein [Nemania diffusa]|nr:heterokaryon incompatibility protein-domain-containing protein [Nemania diffusa]
MSGIIVWDYPTAPTLCHCQPFHRNCDPATCSQARFGFVAPVTSLKNLRKSGEAGCPTCATITNALSVPGIKQIWQRSIKPAFQTPQYGLIRALRDDEEEIFVELYCVNHGTERRILRTRASETSEDWRHFNIWDERPSDQQDDRCRAFPGLKLAPVEHTASARSMEQLKEWLRVCTETHKCYATEDPILPTRVVQVTDDQIRVVDTAGRKGQYMTLSHKWGDDEEFRLTRFNMDFMKDTIPWDAVPKTYQEAIQVTRRLGIKYIWIDSLCIVQDDTEDWRKEAGAMKLVYGNSYLNIAAVRAIDSYGSLFVSSNLDAQYPAQQVPQAPGIQIRPQPHKTHWHFGSNYYSVGETPLLQRGWVLQERILSPRVVYFDTDELKWECQAGCDCQCGSMTVISNFKFDFHRSFGRDDQPLPYQWMRISERYSTLKFTYNSDRLVALAGIAELGVQSGRGGRYLAGLWEHNLAHQLCWKVYPRYKKPDTYFAPSWSWLSLFGVVSFGNRMDYQSDWSKIDVEILEATCTTVDGAVPTTSSSPLLGSIRLKGRGSRMRAKLSTFVSEDHAPSYELRTEGNGEGEHVAWVWADYLMTKDEASAITEVFLLFWGNVANMNFTFFVLKPVSAGSRKFERLGMIDFPEGSNDHQWASRDKMLALCTPDDNIVLV